jgi:glutathione S-transferase
VIRLYWLPASCARVALVALEESGAEFETTVVNKFAGEHERPPYSDLNPTGKVPTLVSDDLVVTELPVILRFLSERYPERELLPSGSLALETQTASTLAWFASGMHPAVARLRHPENVCAEPSIVPSVREFAARQLSLCFDIVERRLDDREWLLGPWSVADAYLQWLWFRSTLSGLDGSAFERCADHARRCEERPSVARTLERERQEIERIEALGQNRPGALLERKPLVALA